MGSVPGRRADRFEDVDRRVLAGVTRPKYSDDPPIVVDIKRGPLERRRAPCDHTLGTLSVLRRADGLAVQQLVQVCSLDLDGYLDRAFVLRVNGPELADHGHVVGHL